MSTAKKILIVDDSETILRMLKLVVKNLASEVMTAGNGLSGLRIAEVEKPSVVLLDIMLPGLDGYNVCRKIKSNPDLKNTKVILFTVKSDKETIEMAKAVGADDFVMKDTTFEKVLEALARALGMGS